VHLHGGHQNALNDRAAEYGVGPGNGQLAEYANDQAVTHLFYHDHAMSVTALNVSVGLIGNYIVGDAQESRLGLPHGTYEIPLTIQDVNFDTDSQGRLDGQIVYKRIIGAHDAPEPGRLPSALSTLAPFTLVNGVVWPHLDVAARAYRFRMVNTSDTRVYRLAVVDEETGKAVPGVMKLIGADMGLLGTSQTIEEAVSLSPAERADIVIDFAAFPGKRLKLVQPRRGSASRNCACRTTPSPSPRSCSSASASSATPASSSRQRCRNRSADSRPSTCRRTPPSVSS
jgi:spore coat protein A